jgi:hypothetical protein
MVLETLGFFSPFNHLTRSVARENFIINISMFVIHGISHLTIV